jgi:hypothetical protein
LESDIARLIRYRNYAEELRVIASERVNPEDYEALRRIAADYDRMAASVERVIDARALVDRVLSTSK